MNRDANYRHPHDFIGDFNFGAETARVFDDMLGRSVPLYHEVQRMLGEMAADFATPGSRLYDLGCSTGTTLLALDPVVSSGVTFVGVDSSSDMLDEAHHKFDQHSLEHTCELICQNLENGLSVENASVVIMNLTLQFIRPLHRNQVIRTIAGGVREGGCLILVEKVLSREPSLNRLFIKYYHDFKKRNGYSELEIAQKREALENVLIPYHEEENRELLLNNGFQSCETFFRWYNFCGMIAVK